MPRSSALSRPASIRRPTLTFNLADADLTTALRVADAINLAFNDKRAKALDGVSISIDAPQGKEGRIMMMGLIENIQVKPADPPAKVIVNARTGTVVINGQVQITPAAISHGKLTVTVKEAPRIVQPATLLQGRDRGRTFELGRGQGREESDVPF